MGPDKTTEEERVGRVVTINPFLSSCGAAGGGDDEEIWMIMAMMIW